MKKLKFPRFFIVFAHGFIGSQFKAIGIDDAIRISNAKELSLNFQGELFYAEAPTTPSYKPVGV